MFFHVKTSENSVSNPHSLLFRVSLAQVSGLILTISGSCFDCFSLSFWLFCAAKLTILRRKIDYLGMSARMPENGSRYKVLCISGFWILRKNRPKTSLRASVLPQAVEKVSCCAKKVSVGCRVAHLMHSVANSWNTKKSVSRKSSGTRFWESFADATRSLPSFWLSVLRLHLIYALCHDAYD